MYTDFIISNTPTSRLDRWLKRELPTLTQGQLEKWLRSKDILVNGSKAQSSTRINEGDTVSIKTVVINILQHQTIAEKNPLTVVEPDREEADFLAGLILYDDDEFLILNKPAGLATQGGTDTHQHVDGLLKAYSYYYHKKQTLRLVHRLDKDTSGILVVAKTLKVAHHLADQFKANTMQKIYWAVCVGKPSPLHGKIQAPLVKKNRPSGDGEAVYVDFKQGKKAETTYRVVKSFAHLCWMELRPHTGRTHQLRVHTSFIKAPILGDQKYGEYPQNKSQELRLHLHARSLKLSTLEGDIMTFTAPPPEHFIHTLQKNAIDWESFI